jgi:hypothetical protein
MACIVLAIETMAPDTRLPHEKLLAYQLALDVLKQVRALDFADAKLADQILSMPLPAESAARLPPQSTSRW